MRPAIGTYIPGDSTIHRADPRAKLVVSMLAVAALFAFDAWPVIVGLVVTALAATIVSGVPLGYTVRLLKPVAFLAVFTLAINTLAIGGAATDLARAAGPGVDFGWLVVSWPGFMRGMYFVLRLAAMMLATTAVTLTTSPVALSDGMASLMRPLRAVRVPVDDVATMVSIALRFIPTILDEVDRIVAAQTARGAQFSDGSLGRRLNAWIPVIIPLFVQMFRRADTLALAMEARCYGSARRTHLRELKLRPSDVAAMVVAALVVVALGAVYWFGG